MSDSPASNEKVDSFLGYFVEAPRALFHIISDDSVGKVRIENFEDVSIFDYEGKIKKLEQVKYKIPCNFTDYSRDLWNTLYNWFNTIKSKNRDELCSNIKFILYSWDKCKVGNLANEFLDIKTKNNFEVVWNKLEIYFKNKDKYKDGDKDKDKKENIIKKYFEKLNTDKEVVEFILKSFYIEQPAISSSEDFTDMIIKKYGDLFKSIEQFNIYIKGRFGIYLENPELKTKKIIEITRKQFNFYKDRYDRLCTYDLVDFANISTEKIENLKSSLMVKQLEEVNLNNSVKTAIMDFIAWDTLCNDCFSNGYLNELDAQQVYLEAKNEWNEHRNYLQIQSPEYSGAELYSRCCNERISPKRLTIQGTQKRVTRGVYNTLANKSIKDQNSVGWHYQYEEKFKDFYEKDI